VDLIYIDPPFNTGRQRRLQSIELGRGDKQRNGYQGRTYAYEVTSDLSYPDAMPRPDYLEFMRLRLVEARRVLRKCGSIYVHLDRHSVHHIRLLMDEVFGEERFLNEIIWAYDYGGRPRDRWPPKHDNILWYANSDTWTFNTDAVERIPYMAPSLVGPEKAARGKLPTDVWWITIVPTNGTERTGYPTQKPEKLLERLIVASSNQGDLVLDFFGGSGTTAAVAQRLGRKWVYVDINPEAVRIAQARIDAQMGGLFGPPYEVLRLDTVGLQAGE
jgi:site-specific DNA-methyltransferase (adenine-specific)